MSAAMPTRLQTIPCCMSRARGKLGPRLRARSVDASRNVSHFSRRVPSPSRPTSTPSRQMESAQSIQKMEGQVPMVKLIHSLRFLLCFSAGRCATICPAAPTGRSAAAPPASDGGGGGNASSGWRSACWRSSRIRCSIASKSAVKSPAPLWPRPPPMPSNLNILNPSAIRRSATPLKRAKYLGPERAKPRPGWVSRPICFPMVILRAEAES
mmetsp:Transcript_163200/g.523443  ORF Transcript_163200/g.523443 Transcript_163200/m.523443 type:complete len:211 (-) Transcript_163200:2051-2683(-)